MWQTLVFDLDILGPRIFSLSPWRNRRNVYLIYNQTEKMTGDPRITRSPSKKKTTRIKGKRQTRKPRKMKDQRNRQSIGQNKLPTPHVPSEETITSPRRDTLKAYSSAQPSASCSKETMTADTEERISTVEKINPLTTPACFSAA